ncbi:DsbA family protein [Microvirga mediterraneensis]|uniref:Thioredoxin domain-containing protein n=1 Tax=Microvirga mediterraneensis TaxID=2754695 RepID=A0A838BVM2_9HYPH|nr:thioredoxin domain-containing protein [Microvirga mediterraneensis]MBA1159310.1 thioredoxin domain-containing protein [Microvirga mediterraneensis]
MAALAIPITGEDHLQGREGAPLKLVEYGNYECRRCGAAHPIVKAILEHFGPEIVFVYRHFALLEGYPNAERAAEVAELAAAHGRFWEMHDLLYANQEHLTGLLPVTLARQLALPENEIQEALIGKRFAVKIHTDFTGGLRSGVTSTPTFFINGLGYEGPAELEPLTAAIEAERSGSGSS